MSGCVGVRVETEYQERVREGNGVNWKESKEIIRHFRWMFLALALAGVVLRQMCPGLATS